MYKKATQFGWVAFLRIILDEVGSYAVLICSGNVESSEYFSKKNSPNFKEAEAYR
jgi:hypothetical protein